MTRSLATVTGTNRRGGEGTTSVRRGATPQADARSEPVARPPRDRNSRRRTALLRGARPARPDGALLVGHRPDALVDKLLDALSFVGFGRVQVALRIGGDAVDGVEL